MQNNKKYTIYQLGHFYSLIANLSYSREFLTQEQKEIAYIHYGDIHTNKIPEKVDSSVILPYLINLETSINEEKYLLQPGDIVLTDASEDYEGVGKSIEISNIQNKKW